MMKKFLVKCVSALPETAQSQIRDRYWRVKSKFLYQTLYGWVGLEHVLPTGLKMEVTNRGEWWAYNEIFVDGHYDVPIQAALASRSSASFVALDLGANVGFFSFRVFDLIRRQGLQNVAPEIAMVEGSPQTFQILERRMQSQSLPAGSIRMVQGLVGQRTGSAVMQESALGMKSTIIGVPRDVGVNVAFVDLNSLMAEKTEIDLVKCDIEGSELLFVENYGDLLRKTKHAVFELHHHLCDTVKCVRVLEGLGFRQKVLQSSEPFSLVYFSRGSS
jgi:FkbM family methyltransferase